MKKTEIKKIIPLVWIGVLVLWWVWYSLEINTSLYNAVQKIQEIHFWADVGSGVWFKNSSWTVLEIGWTVKMDGTMKRTLNPVSNKTTASSSVIWWTNNDNNTNNETNFILWGDSNTVGGTSERSVILWGKLNTESGTKDSVILASDNVNVWGSESAWIWVSNGNVNWQDSAAYAGKNVTVNWNESLSFWSNVTVNNKNVFVYNSKGALSTTDDNVFVVSADHGMIIGWDAYADTGIQLTVHGAVRVWSNTCDASKLGNIYTVQWSNGVTCTCSCSQVRDWSNTKIQWVPLTDAGQCSPYCENPTNPDLSQIRACWNRASQQLADGSWTWSYEADETTWRPLTTFCADGAELVENASSISFPAKGSQRTWHCKNSWADPVECTADRKDILDNEAKCWKRAAIYPLTKGAFEASQKFCDSWSFDQSNRRDILQSEFLFATSPVTLPDPWKKKSRYCVSNNHKDIFVKCTVERNPCSYCATATVWKFDYCLDVNFKSVSIQSTCTEPVVYR